MNESKSEEIIKLLKEIMSLLRHTMGKLFGNFGVTGPQGMLVGILSKYGKMKVSDLSSKLGLSNSTVSGIIDRLEIQKMVERERSESDKRVVYVSLSSEYEKIHQELHKKVEIHMQSIMDKQTPEDHEKLIEGLEILKRLLSDQK